MILSPPLSALEGIRHGFFTREGGVSAGIYAGLNTGLGSADDRAAVIENRARVASALGVAPARLVTPHQVHSAAAVIVEEVWLPGEGPEVDGLVTDRPGIALGVGSADCCPVLFADPLAGVIGAAHAGWRGALRGVLEATLDAMEELGAERRHVVAAIGPTISADAYEVGPEFVARFLEADPDHARFFVRAERAGHSMFDLPAFVAMRLEKAGVGAVDDLDLCTYADETRFFSYRRSVHRGEADYGRLLSAITLAE